MRMSKSFGPLTGPVNALDSDNAPLNTTVSFAPTLLANAAESASAAAVVVERSTCTFDNVDENAAPNSGSGLKRIASMNNGFDPNSPAP
jgi:hypothetical protein